MFKVPTFQESKEKSLFYTRQQGSSTFNFYVGIDKQLIAEMVKDGKNKLFQIDGVPCDLQKELNEEKLKKLQKALDQCFFSTEKGKVLLKIRGNGGWGDDLHRGYDGKKEDKWEPWLLLKAGIRFKKFNKKSKRHFIYHGEGVQGTFKWAKETGLGGKHDLIAAHIAHYSNSIDYNPMTNPFVDQSWHFNLSPKEADLLAMLCMHQNDVLQRDEALRKIWGEDSYFTTRSMDVFITKLRKYLKEDPAIEIENIHGNGFRLFVKQ